jgi:serine phosphatase RsbU (regulator of sigma subunit)
LGEEFGEDRPQELLASGRSLSVVELRERIMAAVSEFSARNAHDDATLMVLKVT